MRATAESHRAIVGGRFAEFMLVGGATLVLFPLAWLLRRSVGLDASELAVGFLTFYGAYVINDPHFAVTYLLFYKDVRKRALGRDFTLAQRIRYLVAGLVVPLALAAWAVVALALHSAQTLGWMIQLMFLLVGWHYVKQGFGVLTVLSARRGVARQPRDERTVILFHCFAGWAFAWANPAIAGRRVRGERRRLPGAGASALARAHAGAVLALSTVALVWRARRRDGAAKGGCSRSRRSSGFSITVWSWTIYSSIDPLVRYVIPALHSVQYLYFVWLMKRNEARERRRSAALRASGRGSPRRPRAVRARARLVSLPRRARRSSTARSSAPTPRHGGRRARRDAVLRGVLRRREHPPLLHGLRHLAPRQPRHALPTRG